MQNPVLFSRRRFLAGNAATAAFGHSILRAAPANERLNIAFIGYKLRRKLTWDPAKEEFPGDAEANALTTRKPRAGWEYA